MINEIDASKAPPEVQAMLIEHDLSNPTFIHTNLIAAQCTCIVLQVQVVDPADMDFQGNHALGVLSFGQPPKAVVDHGPACPNCGSIMQPTGSCHTCGTCGFNGGCG